MFGLDFGLKPNILFIITDQQRYDTISAQGFSYVDTPNLDRLVHEGVCFTNNFVTSASCGPSRASLFKGYYPHTTGIYRNADLWQHSWVENLAINSGLTETEFMTMVRSKDWKLVHYLGNESGELYDLKKESFLPYAK